MNDSFFFETYGRQTGQKKIIHICECDTEHRDQDIMYAVL